MGTHLNSGFTETELEGQLLPGKDVRVGSALEAPLQLLQLVRCKGRPRLLFLYHLGRKKPQLSLYRVLDTLSLTYLGAPVGVSRLLALLLLAGNGLGAGRDGIEARNSRAVWREEQTV